VEKENEKNNTCCVDLDFNDINSLDGITWSDNPIRNSIKTHEGTVRY